MRLCMFLKVWSILLRVRRFMKPLFPDHCSTRTSPLGGGLFTMALLITYRGRSRSYEVGSGTMHTLALNGVLPHPVTAPA